ncbi:hypothetical protein J4463_00665 [Candidatus Pacearchaeota archaeon]|nr:hypothetical protein [Candidatus Pacearchaeota archaeon]
MEQETIEKSEKAEEMSEEKVKETKKKKASMERVVTDKVRGRVIIFNPELSVIAKNLKLDKKADYCQKGK